MSIRFSYYSTALARLFTVLVISIILSDGIINAQTGYNSEITTITSGAFEVMRQFFDYDRVVPFDDSIAGLDKEKGYTREKIFFKGHRSEVPCYLAVPEKGTSPYPVVILQHGLTSSKESWWEKNSMMWKLTEQLLSAGYAVFTIDAEYHGERSGNNPFTSPADVIDKGWFVHFRDIMLQSVIDIRRGLDYLASREDIDTSRIGMVGYSMGGIMTFILSAVEERIDVSVSCVSPIITVPNLPTAIQNYAPYIKETPVLMLMGKNDLRNYTEESANQIYNLIGSNRKNIVFFESGHMLPDEWTKYAADWIVKYLRSSLITKTSLPATSNQ